jgi:hypothetical protein
LGRRAFETPCGAQIYCKKCRIMMILMIGAVATW